MRNAELKSLSSVSCGDSFPPEGSLYVFENVIKICGITDVGSEVYSSFLNS